MKKIIYTLSVFTVMSTSCSSPEKEVAERTCGCTEQLIEFQNDENVKQLDEWWNAIDMNTRMSISVMGDVPDNIDKEKVKQFNANKEKAEKLNKSAESCMKAIQDEYGKETLENEEFSRKMRIELRDICPETAKLMGI